MAPPADAAACPRPRAHAGPGDPAPRSALRDAPSSRLSAPVAHCESLRPRPRGRRIGELRPTVVFEKGEGEGEGEDEGEG